MSHNQLSHTNQPSFITPDGYTSDISVFTIDLHYPEEHKPPVPTLKILLIQRAESNLEGEPNIEAGKWALPGGFVRPQETAAEAAIRELKEEAGVDRIHLKHFAVYDAPGRDPRGWILSNAFYAIVKAGYLAGRTASEDAAEVELFTWEEALELDLAFDHRDMLNDAFRMIQGEMLQTTVAKEFLPEAFTLSELRSLLLLMTDDPGIANVSAFNRDAPKYPFLEPVTDREGNVKTTTRTAKRATRLFRFRGEAPAPSIY
ncbi:NUDIX domain-containing protein [Rossellomorea marisflavi]|uniref:NUDIX domain-containing protein n=1 Tax=Rossellomorea marisflavi TaxID=189381 RepID=UPI003514E0CB